MLPLPYRHEKEVVCFFRLQCRPNCVNARITYRTRGQPLMLIRIVRRIHLEVCPGEQAFWITKRVSYRRICLQLPILLEPVMENTRNAGPLRSDGRLFFNNRSEDDNFVSCEFSVPNLNIIGTICHFIPLPVELFKHHLNDCLRCRPFREPIGIRKKIAFRRNWFVHKTR